MTPLRHYLHDRRHLAMAIMMIALLMRLLVPVGFMPEVSAGKIGIVLCTGQAPALPAMSTHHGGGHHEHGQSAKHDMPCPFSAGSSHGLAAVDPIQIAIALAFVMLLSLRPVTAPRASVAPRLRPPLRGPPAFA
jgi:hypothetical protein